MAQTTGNEVHTVHIEVYADDVVVTANSVLDLLIVMSYLIDYYQINLPL